MILDCISFGVDHFGGDIKCVPAASYIECNDICIKEPKCRRWSLNIIHYYRQCFLKREDTENKDDPLGDRCNSFTGFKNSESKICDSNGKEMLMKFANMTVSFVLSISIVLFQTP